MIYVFINATMLLCVLTKKEKHASIRVAKLKTNNSVTLFFLLFETIYI